MEELVKFWDYLRNGRSISCFELVAMQSPPVCQPGPHLVTLGVDGQLFHTELRSDVPAELVKVCCICTVFIPMNHLSEKTSFHTNILSVSPISEISGQKLCESGTWLKRSIFSSPPPEETGTNILWPDKVWSLLSIVFLLLTLALFYTELRFQVYLWKWHFLKDVDVWMYLCVCRRSRIGREQCQPVLLKACSVHEVQGALPFESQLLVFTDDCPWCLIHFCLAWKRAQGLLSLCYIVALLADLNYSLTAWGVRQLLSLKKKEDKKPRTSHTYPKCVNIGIQE